MISRGWSLVLAGVENFILINAVLSVVGFIIAVIFRSNKLVASLHPRTRARLYATTLTIPPVVSAWLVCASLLPAVWLGEGQWKQEHGYLHTIHLLNAFTISLDPALGYATLCFVTLAAVIVAYAAVSAYFRIGRVIRRLEVGAQPAEQEQVKLVAETCWKHRIAVGLVVSNDPFSFVWGYLDSKLVVSTGLLNQLSKDELTAVLEHETAHHTRRDNLAKLALTGCRYLTPAFPLTGWLYRWWSEQVEMICDEVAVCQTQAPVELAGALVQLKRLTLAVAPPMMRPAASELFGDGKANFEQRVERMLLLADQADLAAAGKLSSSPVGVIIITSVIFALSLAALFAVSPLAIHRVLESILHIF